MRTQSRYLDWAGRFYGQVEWDLATSGIATLPSEELFALDPAAVPRPDDLSQTARFRALVASRYGVPEAEVWPALGASGGLFAAYGSLIERGDEVLVESPTYEPIRAVAAGLGARVRTFSRDPASSFPIDIDAVLDGVRPDTRLVAITNPHNPGGVFAGDELIGPLARELAVRGVTLVIDEVYREFTAPRTTAYRLAPNVCISASLTKRFGLGWARAGWAVLPPSVGERTRDVLLHTSGMAPPWQAGLAAFAFAHLDRLTERTRRLQEGKREIIEAFAARHEDRLAWVPPAGEMPFAFFRDRRDEEVLARIEAGIAEERVIVAPGAFFGCPTGFRLSFTSPRERLSESLARLERALGL